MTGLKRKLLFVAYLQIIACYTYAKNNLCDSLCGKTYAEQYYVLDGLYEPMKKAEAPLLKKQFWEMEQCAEAHKDQQLKYGLRLIKYRIYISEHIVVPDFEDSLSNYLDEVDKKGFNYLKAQALDVFSMYYWVRLKAPAPAFEYLLTAYDIYRNVPETDFPPKYTLLYNLAIRYCWFNDYETARRLLAKAIKTMPVPNAPYGAMPTSLPAKYNVLNLLGLCYRNMGIYDSAVYYFNLAIANAEELEKDVWVGILKGNIGITYYHQQKYHEAIPLLEEDIRICLERDRAVENVPKSMAMLADAYVHTGQPGKAITLLEQLSRILSENQYWGEYDMLQTVYATISKTYFSLGLKDRAYAFLDSAQTKKDSLYLKNNALILAGAERKMELDNRRAIVKKLRGEAELERLRKNWLITALVLLAGMIILFINRQRIALRRRSERAEAEKQKVEAELAGATQMLDSFTQSVHEKNEMIEKFSAEIEKLRTENNGGLSDEYNEVLLQLEQTTILTDEQWDRFRSMFEKVHGGYLNRLKTKLPGLSPAETRIMALSKLKLSNKEMAGMLGISPDAVRMSKHRLRKKLDLAEDNSIDNLADII